MRILPTGTTVLMTAAAYIDRARGWARTIEDREALRSGQPLPAVRPTVARRLGIATGTLENLRKGRLKAVAVHVYDRLRNGIIAELEAELRHVQHEIQVARQAGLDPASGEAHALLASEKRLREALGLDAAATSSDGEGG